MRVVLYAEGAGELGGEALPPAPGKMLWDELLGPAHVLIAKAISVAISVPHKALQFEQPLRTRGRLAKGSDLISKRTLRQLLTWANPALRPELAIVLVDRDGEPDRRKELLAATQDLQVARVIAVAVEEFESWLLADPQALAAVIGEKARLPGRPENLRPGEAKRLLADWCAQSDSRSGAQIRRSLANHADAATLLAQSASFAELVEDLRRS